MNNLFNPSDVSSIISRIEKLKPDSQRLWGKMTPAQMLAHNNVSIETGIGKNIYKQVFIGKLIGSFHKKSVLGEKPFGKNSPTDKSYIFSGDLSFDDEKLKLIASIRKFHEGGSAKCTTHPHPFFGKFTPDQWAVFQWKHLDHHLRQFGV